MNLFDKNTFVISDTHFHHDNIVKYCSRPMEHNNIMQDRWATTITDDDLILHLGDVIVWFNDKKIAEAIEVVQNLPGQKFLVFGNHDKLKRQVYVNMGFTILDEFIQEFDGKRVLFSHYPDTTRLNSWDINIHGHIHNNGLNNAFDPAVPMGRDYRNVSVEVIDYRPIKIGDVLD